MPSIGNPHTFLIFKHHSPLKSCESSHQLGCQGLHSKRLEDIISRDLRGWHFVLLEVI
jgi:hypothetical protein